MGNLGSDISAEFATSLLDPALDLVILAQGEVVSRAEHDLAEWFGHCGRYVGEESAGISNGGRT